MSNDVDTTNSTSSVLKQQRTTSTRSLNRNTASATANNTKTNRRHIKRAVYVNTGFLLAIFFVMIQIFDPSLHNSIHDDVLHQHINHNPMISSLDNFSTRRSNIQDRQHQPTDTTRQWNREAEQNDRIVFLLNDAGITKELSESQKERIPRWENVVDLFGDDVVIVGKEDCERYRNTVPLSQRQLGVAGMFNTGTNLLETQFYKNIRLPQESLWQVPWGKHRMADVKYNHTAAGMEQHNKENVLPVVVIRDPFAWLQSMCASPYAANWRHGTHHCPNLIPNDEDNSKFTDLKDVFEVTVVFDKESKRHFRSLVHLWSEWYAQYLHVDYPILMIRYEDLVFQPATVLQEIANCVEGTVQQPIQYQLKSSKAHGSGTDYIKALVKTADAKARSNNMTVQDLNFAHQQLDHRLMKTFHYHVPTVI